MHSHSAYSAEGNLNLYDWIPAKASVETRLESCLTRDFTEMQRGTSLGSFFHIILPNLRRIHVYIYIQSDIMYVHVLYRFEHTIVYIIVIITGIILHR